VLLQKMTDKWIRHAVSFSFFVLLHG